MVDDDDGEEGGYLEMAPLPTPLCCSVLGLPAAAVTAVVNMFLGTVCSFQLVGATCRY